jgi:chloride channel protein, CIC family
MPRRLRYMLLKSFDLKTQVLLRVAVTGVIIGIVGVGFRISIEKINHFLFHDYYDKQHWYDWFYLPIVCMIGGFIAAYLTQRFAKDASGSGIPQVKHALNSHSVQIRLRTVLTKFVSGVIGIASGLSLGREGPTIHIGAGLGSKISSLLGGKHRKRAIASGAGAGLAAAFNTPIAGVLFVIEELDHDFSSVSLGPAIVGSVCAAVTCRLLYGDFFTFHFQSEGGVNLGAMPLYIFLGILAGLMGTLFQRSIIYFLDFYKKSFHWLDPCFYGALAGLFTGLVGLWIPEALGGGHVVLEGTLAQAYSWWWIPIIFIAKFLLTCVAYGSGVPGGIFAPSLVLGALLGSIVGSLSGYLFPGLEINPATFAFVGMGAFFTGISRAPITSIVMLFELTGNYELVLPLMFACIISNVTTEKIHVGSIYEDLLRKDGIELEEYAALSYLQKFTVDEAMMKNIDTVPSDLTLYELQAVFNRSKHTGFPVVELKENSPSTLVGIVTKGDINRAFDRQLPLDTYRVEDIMTRNLVALYPSDNLQAAILRLYEHKVGRLVVVDPNNPGKLLGLITRSDIIDFEASKELDH